MPLPSHRSAAYVRLLQLMPAQRPIRVRDRRSYKELIEAPFRQLRHQRKKLPWSSTQYFPVEISNRRFDHERQCEVVDVHYQGYSEDWDETKRPLAEIVHLCDHGEQWVVISVV